MGARLQEVAALTLDSLMDGYTRYRHVNLQSDIQRAGTRILTIR